MKFAGKIINGKLTLDDNLGFRDYLHLIEGDVHLEIKRAEKVREAEMHETLKEKYDIESTKQLAMEEFTDLIETIKRWAVIDMGIVLPNAKQPHQ